MTLRWVEIGNNTTLVPGMPVALPAASLGAAILPATSQTLNVMQAEVARLAVLSQDSVIPISLQVPRRVRRKTHQSWMSKLTVIRRTT